MPVRTKWTDPDLRDLDLLKDESEEIESHSPIKEIPVYSLLGQQIGVAQRSNYFSMRILFDTHRARYFVMLPAFKDRGDFYQEIEHPIYFVGFKWT